VVGAAQTEKVPSLDSPDVARFLLPKILRDAADVSVMQRVIWLQKRESAIT
jgi:hypothetical protein